MKIRLCGVLVCGSMVMLATTGFAQIIQGDPCAPVVRYEPFNEESYGFDKITLSRTSSFDSLSVPTDSLTRIFSRWETHWLLEKTPNFLEQGPWTTVLIVGSYEKPKWTLKFKNHASGGVNSRWINEHLLFVRVWWGRIASTDLIIDTDTGKYMYRESANYGEFLINCPDSTQKRN